VTDPDGNETAYEYETGILDEKLVGYAPSASQPPPSDTVYAPSTSTLLDSSVTNPTGAVTSYTYAADGQVTSTTDPLGAATSMSYASTNAPDCWTTALASSACGSLSPPAPVSPGGTIAPPSSAPPEGATYEQTDTDGNVLWSTTGVYEPGSSSASYSRTTYDLYDGNTLTLGSDHISCNATPPSASLWCATVNADGVVTQLVYDSDGDLTSSSTPDGNGSELSTTTYSYDADGERTSTTSPDGNISGANAANFTTTTAHDSDGEVTSTSQAGGSGATVTARTISYGYDGDGNKTSVTDARGYETTYAFDADDRQVLATDPDDDSTLTCYDGDGNTTETVPPVGVAAESLTAASCPTSYPSGYGDRLASDATTGTFDAQGQEISETAPAPPGQSGYETTTDTYDQDGNLVETVAPPTSSSEDAPDQVTLDTYDDAGQMTSQTVGAGTGAASTTSWCYDPEGDRTAVVAPDGDTSGIAACSSSSPWTTSSGYQTTYEHDSAGEVVSTTRPATTAAPDGATTTSTYDDAGNLLTTTDPDGVTTTDTYTPQGHVASTTYSDDAAPSVTFTYDAQGDRTAMDDGTGSSSYVYDPFGELTSEENGADQTVGYAYDADGDVTGVTYPLPGSATWASSDTVTYGFDHADNMNSVTDFNGNEISVTDTADGLPSSESLGSSGDSVDATYGQTDAPSAVDLVRGESTLLGFSYSDAPSGDILSETDTPSGSASYTYDSQARVTAMTSGSETYGYDASGALTTLPNGATGTYDDAGELTSSTLDDATTDYTYSADGNQLSATEGETTVASATWNGAGELTSFSGAAADMSTASYNGDGLRASATTTPTGGSESTEDFVWDTQSLLPSVLMDSTNAYVFAGGSAPAEQVNLSTGTVTYLVSDSLGSVRGVVSSSGSLSASTAYDAWGNAASSLAAVTPFGFAGAYSDPTGLVYLIHRYYDPQTGQFLSVDPLVTVTGIPYSYTAGDPVNESDPSGRFYLPLWNSGTMRSGNTVGLGDKLMDLGLAIIAGAPLASLLGFFGPVAGAIGDALSIIGQEAGAQIEEIGFNIVFWVYQLSDSNPWKRLRFRVNIGLDVIAEWLPIPYGIEGHMDWRRTGWATWYPAF
jgi:RHS repeat-associated protein